MAAHPGSLPKPSLTFSVPSVHDGLALDCRVYHPPSLAASLRPDTPPWHKHAAVVAHPYAPLGGCYDDPIVDIVSATLLRLGFLVVTFNFRGAHGSAGRTSWTAKAERADYMSVVGFVSHYVHFLDPFPQRTSRPVSASHDVLEGNGSNGNGNAGDGDGQGPPAIRIRPPTPSPTEPPSGAAPVLLLGGYSYGSMITSQLPSLETILAVFSAPECGTHAAEIRLRAQHLAEMQTVVLASAREAAADHDHLRPLSPRKHVGLRVGGDEEGRKSHEFRRSLSAEFEETIRHGVAELMARTRKGHRRTHSGRAPPRGVEHAPDHLLAITGRTSFRPAYLLVSPLQGVVSNLATMSLPVLSMPGKGWPRFPGRGSKETSALGEPPEAATLTKATAGAEDKLAQNPTLAIYGDRDGFVPVSKLRNWASRLEAVPGSQFRAHEVSSATHFWATRNVALTLREAVATFAASLLDSKIN